MPLNKLDNFIKNTEGRILYVSPSDLDSTDSIDNQGNSLARPFKTLQRALIESSRFSYVKGNSNDLIEKTTILLMPGMHEIDNRPGLAIYADGSEARVGKKSAGATGGSLATETLNLDLNSNFDLTQENNVLYKFNSVHGGVVVPRGTSIVGLDLRKTKLRPKYVPNPTDINVPTSAIFRITGTCYFWQFSLFDGDDLDLVYTDNNDFGTSKKAAPTFSHNKLTVFEYCDGVNDVDGYDSTDLDMYYYKVGNAYNQGSTRAIAADQKYPISTLAFEPQLPEYEIVGAFAPDPLNISTIQAGTDSGVTPIVTVKTVLDHNLQVGTPIKIRGVTPTPYNISAFVTFVSDTDPKVFTYTLPNPDPTLPTGNTSAATVTVETDTVEGASPYIFNCSMRSVYGMNGMLADGSKATGFRSMVVAQFTGISLQKDDRAFVKYDPNNRVYDAIDIDTAVNGANLSGGSSSSADGQGYHLDSGAVYREGWETSHIKITNDAILQIVSVFAIGYTKHFEAQSGGDASITNSNSNFGQLALVSSGFKKESFSKDDKAFITSIISPRAIESDEDSLDWLEFDNSEAGISTSIYLNGYTNKDNKPPVFTQGYKIGAKVNDQLTVNINGTDYSASIVIPGETVSSEKSYAVTGVPDANNSNLFTIGANNLSTSEKVVIISDDGDLPENLETNTVYYVIKVDATTIKLASSESNAENGLEISVAKGSNLHIITRVTDKEPGEPGHPVQYDLNKNKWYVRVDGTTNNINAQLSGTGATNFSKIKRKEDPRSLDEKLYQIRVVIPKESSNAKNPENGFIIQESSNTGYNLNSEFDQVSILTENDYDFKRNLSYISTCSYDNTSKIVSVRTDLPHKLDVGDTVIIKNVTDTTNTSGIINSGYNGTFTVSSVTDNMEFKYVNTQTPSAFMTNDVTVRNISLPRFERNDLQKNLYVYRNETISEYIPGNQDGIYHLYVLGADLSIPTEFTNSEYSQNVRDLYPQMDRDNPNDNPQSSKSFALRSPLGDVATNDLKKSLTRESVNTTLKTLGVGIPISNVTEVSAGVCTVTFAERHGFAGIVTGAVSDGGSGYLNGTYQNVKLYNENSLTTWQGATARVVVSGNAVQSSTLLASGSGYDSSASGDILQYFDTSNMGGSPAAGGSNNAKFRTNATGISSCIGNVVQFTGSGIATDSYATIHSIVSDTQIAIAKTDGDPDITTNQYVLSIAPRREITGTPSSSTVDGVTTTTFNTTTAHGLVAGNSFILLDINNNNLGDFIVSSKTDVDTFTATTTGFTVTSAKYVLKRGLDANEKVSDKSAENLAVRANPIFENDIATLIALTSVTVGNVTTHYMEVALPGTLNGIIERFPYGSYVQIEDEILRIAQPTLSGTSNNKLTVIRGALSTKISNHDANSLIKKIKPLSIEFRRPSILRASGHTFEYLGYGPGNYSTALPQVQDKTLTEREEFLSQSQEKSGGIVVYTGMNNKGDFYIGNLKKSSATGEDTTYDTPIPTVTGQDPARLSAVFDEVTIKEKIKVEGGPGGEILSQFDGPVTINNGFKVNARADITGIARITNEIESTDSGSGALQVTGGVGVAKSIFVGEGIDVIGISTFAADVQVGAGITFDASEGRVDATKLRGDGGELTGLPGGDNPIHFNDGVKAKFGSTDADPDLELYHTGTIGYIDNNTGKLYIRNNVDSDDDGDIHIQAKSGADSIVCKDDDGVDLYWQGAGTPGIRLQTLQNAVSISGDLISSGELDVNGANTSTIAGALEVGGDITAFATSDERLKDNISPIKKALDKVNSISGNTFDWNSASDYEGKGDTGVIAQEIEALNLPGVTTTRDSGYKAVRYEKLVPLLIEAIKELSAKVDNLEQKLSDK